MQKILRRTEYAKKYAARVKLRKDAQRDRSERKTQRQETFQIRKLQRKHVLAARQAYRDDWMLGPLAPRRSVGEHAEKLGSVDQDLVMRVKVAKSQQIDTHGITEGDRVVCVRGRDKGKIGIVKTIQKETSSIQVSGLNVTDVFTPEWRRKADNDPRPYRTIEAYLPFEDVRLVVAIEGAAGKKAKRDVIVEKIEVWQPNPDDENVDAVPYVKVDTSKLEGEIDYEETFRIIPGLPEHQIPWPKKGKPQLQAYESDTLRISSEDQTYSPQLLHPPMPVSVIDELRNKYSKFRDDYDEDFTLTKLFEEEREESKKGVGGSMKTPTMLLNELKAKERQNKPPPVLSESYLRAIGKVMAKNLA